MVTGHIFGWSAPAPCFACAVSRGLAGRLHSLGCPGLLLSDEAGIASHEERCQRPAEAGGDPGSGDQCPAPWGAAVDPQYSAWCTLTMGMTVSMAYPAG